MVAEKTHIHIHTHTQKRNPRKISELFEEKYLALALLHLVAWPKKKKN